MSFPSIPLPTPTHWQAWKSHDRTRPSLPETLTRLKPHHPATEWWWASLIRNTKWWKRAMIACESAGATAWRDHFVRGVWTAAFSVCRKQKGDFGAMKCWDAFVRVAVVNFCTLQDGSSVDIFYNKRNPNMKSSVPSNQQQQFLEDSRAWVSMNIITCSWSDWGFCAILRKLLFLFYCNGCNYMASW